ncbi:hypothetical protein GE09DRAFT_1110502 [Coniochaeta sp. 2T2.1]|nr:hypothetical protein GE09DRAFT_1110502 [Coniochaeta sp. 2T2.1]
MKLPTCSLRVTTHRSLARQPWHIHIQHKAFTRVAAAPQEGPQRPQRRQPHPRQRSLPDQPQPWKPKELLRTSPDLSRGPTSSRPDIDIDNDEAFQTALQNLTITKPEDAPLMDYTKASKPATVRQLCDTLGLSYPETRRVAYDTAQGLEFSLSNKHCFSDYHMRDISDALSPLHTARLDCSAERHAKESLWLNVFMYGGGKKIKAVVKTRGAKRLKHAFYEALRRNGYDKFGVPLGEKEAREAGTRPAAGKLYGTVRIKVFEPLKLASCDYAAVVRYWEQRIRGVIGGKLGEGSRPNAGGFFKPDVKSSRDGEDLGRGHLDRKMGTRDDGGRPPIRGGTWKGWEESQDGGSTARPGARTGSSRPAGQNVAVRRIRSM